MDNIEQEVRQFDLGAILNISTCRVFTNMDDVYDVLSYLMGEEVYTHQIPIVADEARPYVLALYPELNGVGVNTVINNYDDAKAFVDEQKQIFGETLPLIPMPKNNNCSYEGLRSRIVEKVKIKDN